MSKHMQAVAANKDADAIFSCRDDADEATLALIGDLETAVSALDPDDQAFDAELRKTYDLISQIRDNLEDAGYDLEDLDK